MLGTQAQNGQEASNHAGFTIGVQQMVPTISGARVAEMRGREGGGGEAGVMPAICEFHVGGGGSGWHNFVE